MDIELFLVILVIVLIILIIGLIIFNRIMLVNFKSYQKIWEPIYKNRKEHFDQYFTYALENSKSIEPIENVASFATHMRIDDNKANNKNYTYWKDYYLHELRSANIE